MDAVTQLEQACQPACVRLSEAFAVALRPSDPRWRMTYESDVASVNRLGLKRYVSRLNRNVVQRQGSGLSRPRAIYEALQSGRGGSTWGDADNTSFRDLPDDVSVGTMNVKDHRRRASLEAALDPMFDLVAASDLELAGACGRLSLSLPSHPPLSRPYIAATSDLVLAGAPTYRGRLWLSAPYAVSSTRPR